MRSHSFWVLSMFRYLTSCRMWVRFHADCHRLHDWSWQVARSRMSRFKVYVTSFPVIQAGVTSGDDWTVVESRAMMSVSFPQSLRALSAYEFRTTQLAHVVFPLSILFRPAAHLVLVAKTRVLCLRPRRTCFSSSYPKARFLALDSFPISPQGI